MKVIIPIPSSDFDPTESAIPWKLLTEAGHDVLFATPDGRPGACDDRLISGRGFSLWTPFLKAREDAIAAYRAMLGDEAHASPLRWSQLSDTHFDAAVLPGGHARGMRPYLESPEVRRLVLRHFSEDKPIGAICHGVLAVARTIDPERGRSVLYGRRTTALPASMEMSAWLMTCGWLGNYYRTYPETVQAEVTRQLETADDFSEGPFAPLRDGPTALSRGFVIDDGRYVSARWPGDAYAFSHALLKQLQ